MLTRKEIYEAHRLRLGPKAKPLPRHIRNSANILSKISRRLDKHLLSHILDRNWPFHLIVSINNKRLSVHSGGLNNRIDISPIKDNGHPYPTRYEKGFLTPTGAVNYILRKYGKKRYLGWT